MAGWRGFRLAGSNWRDRLVASCGAFLGIGLTGWICSFVAGDPASVILLGAPIGASAVLIFAVPSSPLAQPYAAIVGTIVSTLVGVFAARTFGHTAFAAGFSVGGSILAMSALRCLHAPGGGSALVPVIAGPEVLAHGYALALVPFGLNALVLVVLGLIFHRVSGHSYPHRAPPPANVGVDPEDIDAALDQLGEPFDVSRADLHALVAAAERNAKLRRSRK